ncbi:MAG: hypothetical protein CBD27_12575 [Rhodospirillaceae bacterium TMED167]|nr:oxidoreductase [Rhodospirillaceae bacterium]OUW23146.1 MAG: hypothetical protein CBD27_12575 [Rhodospirillaceae bacterium TMED167]
MNTHTLGIILNGATGRICSHQHLANSLIPIREEGGLEVNGVQIIPDLLLLGRDKKKLSEIARATNLENWTTNLDAALSDSRYSIYFDAAATHLRAGLLHKALAAGKHIYAEKPIAPGVEEGLAILAEADVRGLKHSVVEDKLYLPGMLKLGRLIEGGFFGRVTGFKLEFGWWIFDGLERASQRPSWNYRDKTGGGLISDMYPHWRYMIEGLLGPIQGVVTASSTIQQTRADETGAAFDVDVEDNAHTLVRLGSGAIGSILSSWGTRLRGEDQLTLQIDGTDGSAVAGLWDCWTQSAEETPALGTFDLGRNERRSATRDFKGDWEIMPAVGDYKNPYRYGWESFMAHVAGDRPAVSPLGAGIRDVQLSEACLKSASEGQWIDMAPFPDPS